MHTTNSFDVFLEVADDCPVRSAQVPPLKGDAKTVARIQYELIASHPYERTSDDVLFETHAIRTGISLSKRSEERDKYFSKGQPCLRASALTKRYGWGVHFDHEGRIALHGLGSREYRSFAENPKLGHTKAMRSKRA